MTDHNSQPNISERLERVDASLAAQLGKSIELNARLTERCSAYKGQIEAGAAEIASLTARCEAMEKALREIDAIISDWERVMCLPGAKEIKRLWSIARAALPQSSGLARSPSNPESK